MAITAQIAPAKGGYFRKDLTDPGGRPRSPQGGQAEDQHSGQARDRCIALRGATEEGAEGPPSLGCVSRCEDQVKLLLQS